MFCKTIIIIKLKPKFYLHLNMKTILLRKFNYSYGHEKDFIFVFLVQSISIVIPLMPIIVFKIPHVTFCTDLICISLKESVQIEYP
jgi:hypothetical protein